MRLCVIAALALCSIASVHGAETEVPYIAYIATETAYVFSGPGERYYATDMLRRGEPVEVWRERADGWLAVRPPRNSFSWVASKHLRLTGDHSAVVAGDNVVARVGSSLGDERAVAQVRLERGEHVEVIEAPKPGAKAQQAWCKIAPPSGEFRWISRDFVERPRNTRMAAPDQIAVTRPESSRGLAAEQSRSQPSRIEDEQSTAEQQASHTEPAGGAAHPAWVAKQASLDAGVENGLHESNDSTLELSHPELVRINLALSKIVAEEPGLWQLADLRQEAEHYLNNAATSIDRTEARMVLDRITRFESVQQGYRAAPADSNLANHKAAQLEAVRIPSGDVRTSSPIFDAVGRLAPVVSRRPGAPNYALVTAGNEVKFFVTPAPGLNLQPYVGQTIGVQGQRGFLPELNKPHVMASRVSLTR